MLHLNYDGTIPGTESLKRYPNAAWADVKGIKHFGTVKVNGLTCYKVGRENRTQLESIGWKYVNETAGYCRMIPA